MPNLIPALVVSPLVPLATLFLAPNVAPLYQILKPILLHALSQLVPQDLLSPTINAALLFLLVHNIILIVFVKGVKLLSL